MRIYQGYTLLELMITVAIAGILLSMVVPGYRGVVERNSIATTSNELLGAILYARSEAVKIESDVTFTTDTDGWQVTIESNPAAGIETDIVIVDQPVGNENITLAENIAENEITFNPLGRADITPGDSIDISFDSTVRSHICLNLTGRPYIKSADEGNCP